MRRLCLALLLLVGCGTSESARMCDAVRLQTEAMVQGQTREQAVVYAADWISEHC